MYAKDIGNILGFAPSTINYHAKKMGLKSKKGLDISEDKKQYIINNYKTQKYSEIGGVVGLTAKQVEGWLRNHVNNKETKIRSFNDTYFNDISTPDQAYWLGFIYADGWISIRPTCYNGVHSGGDHYEFGMQLQRGDRYILEKLNETLGNKHIIKDCEKTSVILNNKKETHSQSSVLRVYSKNIVLGLMNNGIDTHKSNSNIFPKVSDNLFPDFLRGYIDGDGCIYKNKKNNLSVHLTGANRDCFEYIQEKLKINFNIETKIYVEHIPNYMDKFRLYCFRKEDVKKFLDMIYYNNDLIKLDRKYKIYQDYYGLGA